MVDLGPDPTINSVGFSECSCCPPLSVLFDTSGVPEDDFQATSWKPVVLSNTAIWTWFFFYASLTLIMARLSRRMFPIVAVEVKERSMEKLGRRDVWARYTASWIHAVLSSLFSIVAILNANKIVDAPLCTFYFVIMHSYGYFIADSLVLMDRLFYIHHLTPLIFGEVMLRIGGSFYHAIWFGLLCELGNVLCHFTALLYLSTSEVYLRVFKWAYGITRPASFVAAVLIWICDVPVQYRYTYGFVVIGCFLMIYGSNLFAFFAVARRNVVVIAASAGAGRFSLGALFSARFGKHKVDSGTMVGPRVLHPMFMPYRPEGERCGGARCGDSRWAQKK